MYVPEEMGLKSGLQGANWSFFGGSGVINPSGEYLAGPVYDEETILYADIDLREILLRKVAIDTTGRDHRWDVLRLDYRPFPYSPFVEPTAARP
jgi:predicted amidohydrolase